MAEIRIEGVRKTFGKFTALHDVSLTIHDREFMILLGPSGCGKTTLLRCIAGLEHPEGGRIFIGGRDVTHEPPRRRQIAMVFQSYAVFPHLTVFDNIAFGLRMQNRPKPEIQKRVGQAAEMMQINAYLDRYPAQLSGGQRQRVAVARALAVEPEVLLMDEPLSNLDALLRLQARAELKRLLQEVQSTTVYVTHDQVEAMSMGDRITVMQAGDMVQVDAPGRVYDAPGSTFVGGFIGNPPMNFVRATLLPSNGAARADVDGQPVPILPLANVAPGQPLLMGIRAENIEVGHTARPETVPSRVLVVEPLGSHLLLSVLLGTEMLKVIANTDFPVAQDDTVQLRLDPAKIRWFDPTTGRPVGGAAA
ncbi:MAG: ABC transporter ATP-binding protein [Anaerolineae bacterium]